MGPSSKKKQIGFPNRLEPAPHLHLTYETLMPREAIEGGYIGGTAALFAGEDYEQLNEYTRRSRSLISSIIWRHVGEERAGPSPSALNSMRVKLPRGFKGQDDIEEFQEWLHEVCQYLAICGVVGQANDRVRIDLLGQWLQGPALSWFRSVWPKEALNPEVGRLWVTREVGWSFEQIIIGLGRRFITRASSLRAATWFRNLEYDEQRDVDSFLEDLYRLACLMPSIPDEKEIKQRFIDGLPRKWAPRLVEFGLYPFEQQTLAQLRMACHRISQIEQNMKALDL